MKDRRAPLGGISKPTFMAVGANSVGEDFAGMLYDMMRDIKACQLRQIKKCDTCTEAFDKRYLKRITEKIPLSWPEFIFAILAVGGLVALGYIDMGVIIKVLKVWL